MNRQRQYEFIVKIARSGMTLAVAAALVAIGAGCSTAAEASPGKTCTTGDCQSPPLRDIYLPSPSYESSDKGEFATGAMFADINGDGRPDLIVSNGNDMSPRPLVVYLNHCSDERPYCFGQWPDYYSDDIDYLGKLTVGDVDHDGWPDVVVAMPFDKDRNIAGGGVKIYRNIKGRLESTPSLRIGGFGAFSCALADVNGDGRLDLVVPVLNISPPGASEPHQRIADAMLSAAGDGRARARIYLNQALNQALNHALTPGGCWQPTPAWESSEKMFGFGVTVADINQDGWMDVAIAGDHTFVYYGRAPKSPDSVPIDPKAAWISSSDGDRSVALAVDAGRIGDGPGLTLAVSQGCPVATSSCASHFALYRTNSGTTPVWRSQPAQRSWMLLLADLNDDGLLDMVGGQWGDEFQGGPLWFFQGQARGGFTERPNFVTEAPGGTAVAEALAVADTRGCASRLHAWSWTATAPGAVITLSERQVESVRAVEVAGHKLSRRDWAFAPGNNWISLAQPYAAKDVVHVQYDSSPVQDLAEATWSPQRGDLIYRSFLKRGSCDAAKNLLAHQETR